eukprot:4976530-Prymnesium_polylepis.1
MGGWMVVRRAEPWGVWCVVGGWYVGRCAPRAPALASCRALQTGRARPDRARHSPAARQPRGGCAPAGRGAARRTPCAAAKTTRPESPRAAILGRGAC